MKNAFEPIQSILFINPIHAPAACDGWSWIKTKSLLHHHPLSHSPSLTHPSPSNFHKLTTSAPPCRSNSNVRHQLRRQRARRKYAHPSSSLLPPLHPMLRAYIVFLRNRGINVLVSCLADQYKNDPRNPNRKQQPPAK